MIFGVYMSSSAHVDNKKKNIFIPRLGSTQGLNDTTLTAEKKVFIQFYLEWEKMCLSLHDNGDNSYTFVNGIEVIEFKAKDSELSKAISPMSRKRFKRPFSY